MTGEMDRVCLHSGPSYPPSYARCQCPCGRHVLVLMTDLFNDIVRPCPICGSQDFQERAEVRARDSCTKPDCPDF